MCTTACKWATSSFKLRLFNEAPLVLLIAVVYLVLAKPF